MEMFLNLNKTMFTVQYWQELHFDTKFFHLERTVDQKITGNILFKS